MDLTESQQEAIESSSPNVLVIAGAGSGKTEVFARRIRRLILEGEKPSSILALTFTRRAAAEMVGRLSGMDIQGSDINEMVIGTFHAVSLRIVQTYRQKLGYHTDGLTIIDEADTDVLLERAAQDLNLLVIKDGKKRWRKSLSMKKIQYALECSYTGRTPVGIAGGPAVLDHLTCVIKLYQSTCKAMNVLDFGLILQETTRLFNENPDVLTTYRGRIRHVLVDELQDTDLVQYNLHRYFSPPATFFGVGDRRQSIYGWRGARPDLMDDLRSGTHFIDLRECFRCGDSITHAANQLIDVNDDPLCKPMLGATGRAGTVGVFTGRSAHIADKIQHICKHGGVIPGDIAVLARKHRSLKRLAHRLREMGIPYSRSGDITDVTRLDGFRDVHAMFRLILNPRDNLAFTRMAHEGYLDLDDAGMSLIRRDSARSKISYSEAYRIRFGAPDHILVTHAANYAANQSVGVMSERLSEQMIIRRGSIIEWQADKVNRFWKSRWFNGGDMPLTEALDTLSTMKIERGEDYAWDTEKVNLLTIHAAKGLEWPVVIIIECNEGELPLDHPDEIKEERRCMYVAMTRARSILLIHYRTDEHTQFDAKEPSRFIDESIHRSG